MTRALPGLLFLGALLTGCASAPPPALLVLGAGTPPASATVSRSTPLLEVTRVQLPDWLNGTDLVLDVEEGVVRRARTARWSERLGVGSTRVLAAKLRLRLANARVAEAPARPAPDYRLIVNIHDLGCRARACVIQSDWEVVRDSGESIAAGRFAHSEPPVGDAPSAHVAAVERQLESLAENVAQGVAAQVGASS